MNNSKKRRTIKYDVMRILMSLFVICIHTPLPDSISGNRLLSNFVMAFLFQCNGIFYMLSGKFNLCKSFDCKKDYIHYYINKFVTILLPYGMVSCLLVLLNVIVSKQYCNMNGYIYQCIEAFFMTNASNHLWFVCALIGILVSVPFLSKMVKAMNDYELKILFFVGIIWNIIAIYLTSDLGFSFRINGWFLWGWIFIFFLGYFCDKIINDKNIKIIYCLGIVGLIISVLGNTYSENFQNAHDLSAGYILFTMSCYLFLERHISIKNELAEKFISYIAKYSFLAYMLHYFILNNITAKLYPPPHTEWADLLYYFYFNNISNFLFVFNYRFICFNKTNTNISLKIIKRTPMSPFFE